MNEAHNPLNLTEQEETLLRRVLELDEDKLLDFLRALHGERSLEFAIYSSREQLYWIVWTTCLAGALVALTRSDPFISIGGPLVTGFIATLLTWLRMPGLKASLDALNTRHKWVVAITENVPETNSRILPLGFRARLIKQQRGDDKVRILDDIHLRGFAFPQKMTLWTPVIWFLLTVLGCIPWLLK